MKLLETFSRVSVVKIKKSLLVYWLEVNGSKIGTKDLANLFVFVFKADIWSQQVSTHFLCTLKEPCIDPRLDLLVSDIISIHLLIRWCAELYIS